MLINAKDKKLSQTISGQPDVSGAVDHFLQSMIFEKMQRSMVDGRMQEIPIQFSALACKQPLSPQLLKVKPTGDRAWSWYMIHSLTDLELKPNDRIKIQGQPFKVMNKSNFKEYGYFYYEIIEDVTDGGN